MSDNFTIEIETSNGDTVTVSSDKLEIYIYQEVGEKQERILEITCEKDSKGRLFTDVDRVNTDDAGLDFQDSENGMTIKSW